VENCALRVLREKKASAAQETGNILLPEGNLWYTSILIFKTETIHNQLFKVFFLAF
jgi:hypothetical protein